MSVEVGDWWGAPVLIWHGSPLAIVRVTTALGRVSMLDGEDISVSVVLVVRITVKDVDFVERCGLFFDWLWNLGPLGLFG